MVATMDILQNLKTLGLDEHEAAVYLKLLGKDTYSLSELSRELNIPRTTVYRICKSLSEKKFLEWVFYHRGKKVKAVKIDNLEYIVNEKKEELTSIEAALQNIKLATTQISKTLPKTQLRYYEGKEGMKQLIWNTLSAQEEILGYSIYGRKEIVGEAFIEKYVINFQKKHLQDKVLINKKILPRVYKALAGVHQQQMNDVKVISQKDFYISGDTYIYNNVYAVNFWNEKEIIGVEIENPEIVKVQKSIFTTLWNSAKPLKFFVKKKL
jgi:sugar-specific transcriptional regulator TrmB